MEKLFLTSNEVADLLNISQQQAYKIIRDMNKQLDTVINACDAGREGESIFRLVYNQVNCKKKMKRLWISSMEDSAIKEGFDHLKDGKDYDNLFESAQARAIADWLVGMNISRLYSCLYQQNYSVGRVQTPTLYMIVKRDDEISNFKKEKYYTVEFSTNGFTLSTDRIDDEVAAEQLLNLVGDKIEIIDVIQKEKITKPDLPFDMKWRAYAKWRLRCPCSFRAWARKAATRPPPCAPAGAPAGRWSSTAPAPFFTPAAAPTLPTPPAPPRWPRAHNCKRPCLRARFCEGS